MKRISIWIVLVCLLILSAYTTQAAFSTPYLPNKTLTLNGSEEFNYEITFQNKGDSPTTMSFKVIQGADWTDPDTFEIDVGAKQFDAKGQFNIKIPDTFPEEEELQYDHPYTIEYMITSGDKGGDGMVPVTSQVKKKFYVVVPQNKPSNNGLVINLITGLLIGSFAMFVWLRNKKKQKHASEETEEESSELDDDENST